MTNRAIELKLNRIIQLLEELVSHMANPVITVPQVELPKYVPHFDVDRQCGWLNKDVTSEHSSYHNKRVYTCNVCQKSVGEGEKMECPNR